MRNSCSGAGLVKVKFAEDVGPPNGVSNEHSLRIPDQANDLARLMYRETVSVDWKRRAMTYRGPEILLLRYKMNSRIRKKKNHFFKNIRAVESRNCRT
jgi:hypothetical protein